MASTTTLKYGPKISLSHVTMKGGGSGPLHSKRLWKRAFFLLQPSLTIQYKYMIFRNWCKYQFSNKIMQSCVNSSILGNDAMLCKYQYFANDAMVCECSSIFRLGHSYWRTLEASTGLYTFSCFLFTCLQNQQHYCPPDSNTALTGFHSCQRWVNNSVLKSIQMIESGFIWIIQGAFLKNP